jgi:hypothetical protein
LARNSPKPVGAENETGRRMAGVGSMAPNLLGGASLRASGQRQTERSMEGPPENRVSDVKEG